MVDPSTTLVHSSANRVVADQTSKTDGHCSDQGGRRRSQRIRPSLVLRGVRAARGSSRLRRLDLHPERPGPANRRPYIVRFRRSKSSPSYSGKTVRAAKWSSTSRASITEEKRERSSVGSSASNSSGIGRRRRASTIRRSSHVAMHLRASSGTVHRASTSSTPWI